MKRVLLVVAAAAFLGWLGWLAYAVSKAGTVPIVSRAQLTDATDLIVAELAEDPNDPSLPLRELTVTDVLAGSHLKSGDRVKDVELLSSSKIPDGKTQGFPGAGTYLVPLKKIGEIYKVAGLPSSPGFGPANRPLIYPWTEEVKVQLRSLGYPVK
jgi:hypothetical protein